jgi:hypothetical protein
MGATPLPNMTSPTSTTETIGPSATCASVVVVEVATEVVGASMVVVAGNDSVGGGRVVTGVGPANGKVKSSWQPTMARAARIRSSRRIFTCLTCSSSQTASQSRGFNPT